MSDGACVFCDSEHKPTEYVQLKSRVFRPIPYSKHRSARILKKLKKRQALMNAPLIFTFNSKTLELMGAQIKETMDEHIKNTLKTKGGYSMGAYLLGEESSPIKHRTWEIDFDEPYDPETDRAIFRLDAHSKKSFEEIERFDIKDQTKVNNHWVVILRSGEKVRYLKGGDYAKSDLHQSEIEA